MRVWGAEKDNRSAVEAATGLLAAPRNPSICLLSHPGGSPGEGRRQCMAHKKQKRGAEGLAPPLHSTNPSPLCPPFCVLPILCPPTVSIPPKAHSPCPRCVHPVCVPHSASTPLCPPLSEIRVDRGCRSSKGLVASLGTKAPLKKSQAFQASESEPSGTQPLSAGPPACSQAPKRTFGHGPPPRSQRHLQARFPAKAGSPGTEYFYS